MGVSRKVRRKLAGLGTPLLIGLLCAAPAQAAAPLKVREIFPGSDAHGANAEYVELQMTAAGQATVQGQDLRFYDGFGNLASTYSIPADVADGESQRTVLLATQEAVDEALAPVPDFNLGSGEDRIAPSGGAVCLTGVGPGSDDCATWGSIPIFGMLDPFPDPQLANAAAVGDGLALRRSIAPGCPTYLDAADDSGDSSADFAQVAPDPRANAAVPSEVRCPPDTVLLTYPDDPSNQASALFTYAAVPGEAGVSFECSLDGAPFTACSGAGRAYPGPLSEGIHTFAVRAAGEGGQDPTPREFAWSVDTLAPETTLDAFPPEPSGGFEAAFSYHSSEPSSSFRCQLDDGAVQVCSAAGKTYYLLADGHHVFRAWAVDNAGNQDPTPAERAFTVRGVLIDRTPPDTTIVSAPPNPSSRDSASFAYSSSEPGSSFECSLNGSPFGSCSSSGTSYSRLRNATYVFAVKATDAAGNSDSVPATYSWTVGAPLPRVTFAKSPPGHVRLRKGRKAKLFFRLRADKPGSSFRCRLDKRQFRRCRPAVRLRAAPGRHRFEAYAIDELGNVGTSVARRIVRVQKRKRRIVRAQKRKTRGRF